MTNWIPGTSKVVLLFTPVIGVGTATGLAATTPASNATRVDESSRVCKFDGKISSIGAVIKDGGQLYRCTLVFEERAVTKAAWVQVQMTTSIVIE